MPIMIVVDSLANITKIELNVRVIYKVNKLMYLFYKVKET